MDNIKVIFELTLLGALDCIYGLLALKRFWQKRNAPKEQCTTSRSNKVPTQTKTVFEVLTQCIVFGLLFWLAIYAFHHVFIDVYYKYLTSLCTPDEVQSISWLPGLVSVMFGFLWTLPLFLVSRVLNYSWYQEIANLTCEDIGIQRRANQPISLFWSDQITSTTVQILFMVQGYVVFLFPIPTAIQWILSTLHLALLYALYAFEYKWIVIGWSMHKRLAYVDSKWPYFVGFGLPLAIVSSYVGSYIESICIFSVLFPLALISSTNTTNNRLRTFNRPLKSFGLVILIADSIICRFCRLIKQ